MKLPLRPLNYAQQHPSLISLMGLAFMHPSVAWQSNFTVHKLLLPIVWGKSIGLEDCCLEFRALMIVWDLWLAVRDSVPRFWLSLGNEF